MKRIILTLCSIFLLTNNSLPQTSFSNSENNYPAIADTIIRTALTEQTGYGWLKELCGIGPRLSGSEQSMKAILWAKDKMENMGVDKVWLQNVMVPKWVRGDIESAQIVSSKKYKGRKLNVTAFGGSIAAPDEGVTAQVVEVKSFDELKKLGGKVKGKIVFYNRAFDNGLVNSFEAYGKAVDQRTAGAIEAAKLGAVASIVRSITSKNDNVTHTGVMYYDSLANKIPTASIGVQDAEFLSSAIKEEPDLAITIKMDCKKYPDVLSYNVIGEITGSEKPEEIIVIGGHFDSWDKGCGAHDDGAPCIQTMEALHLLKKFNIKPKRTIRCVLFINEENGARGGKVYGAFADTAKEKQIAALESDRGAFTPRGFYVTSDSSTVNKMQAWLSVLNKASIDWIRHGGSGVDVSFIKNTKALLGFAPDEQRYMDVHHSDNDTFESVHPREMELGTAAITIMAYLLSEEL